jgi:AcrR family transcriptional regulator
MATIRTSKEDVVAAFRRGELLNAALRVFGARGFEQATMDAIAEEAEVAKGTIYLYYPSKQAIYDAAFDQSLSELQRLTDARIEAAPNAKDAVAGFVDVRVRYFQDHRDYYRIYVSEMGRQLSDHAPRRNACKPAMDAQTRSLQRVLERAVKSGEVRPIDPASAALAVFDITRGLVGRRLLTCAKSDVARDIAFITDLIWSGLKHEGQTA